MAVIRRHSEWQAVLPRRWKRSKPRLNFVCANTGSMVLGVFGRALAELGLEHGAHECVGAAVPAGAGAFALVGVGRDQHRHAPSGDLFHLRLVPVAGVGDDHAGLLGDAGGFELRQRGVDHRAEVPEV